MEYDAFLLVSFGGPEGPDDVMPFLENVTRGRGVPRERLAEVAEHYRHFGGVSPINGQCRELLAALAPELPGLPMYWGNRNWQPYLTDTVATMRDDGVRRAIAFVTSAYGVLLGLPPVPGRHRAGPGRRGSGRAGDRQDPAFPRPSRLRHAARRRGDGRPEPVAGAGPSRTRVVFTAHSIPTSMEAASGPDGGRYTAQLRETAGLVAGAGAPELDWDLVWQSRSGPPRVPWLEPDVNDHLEALAADGVRNVVVSPIGFVSDHLEVVWDLDNEAAETARKLGISYARAATPGTDPRYVAMIRDLVAERQDPARSRHALGLVPTWDACPADCCPARP